MTAQADITMILRNLKFALNSAWQSFWRNLAVSLAAVLSITLILILAGINLLVGHALSQVLDGFRAKVSEISINVSDDTPLQSVYDFEQVLTADPRVASVALLLILMLVSVVIVMNTIRTAVYHRRKEIEVMKLVGATEWFVRGTFVIEGIMTGLIAASTALALLVVAYPPAVDRFKSDLGFIPLSYDPRFISILAQY